LTIHKSQGSEYGTVIIPIVRNVTEQNTFLTRNILYTALTRAKSRVVFVGNIQSFKAVAQKVRTKRKTGLSDLFSQRDS
jgi:ATP-dependent exoDNAse (exonuclease V), alpha subunit-helicase superfamily I member